MAISSNIGVWTFLFLEGSPSVLGGDFYEMFIHLTASRCFFYIYHSSDSFPLFFFIYQGFFCPDILYLTAYSAYHGGYAFLVFFKGRLIGGFKTRSELIKNPTNQ